MRRNEQRLNKSLHAFLWRYLPNLLLLKFLHIECALSLVVMGVIKREGLMRHTVMCKM